MTAADQPIPEPGSLWIRKARCEAWHDKPGATSRTVHINVDRFRPIATGYRPAPVEGTTTEADQ